MSVKMSSMVWEACLGPEKKYILLALADQANDEGYCVYRNTQDITHAAIARKTELSVRTIRRQIAELLHPDRGFLEITREASHHSPPEYRIRVAKLATQNEIIKTGKEEKRVDKLATLNPVDKTGLGGHSRQSGWPLTTGRVAMGGHSHIRCLDVDSRNITLSSAERDFCVKEIKRLFPGVLSIPKDIPMERVYLFLHKVRTGEIRKEQIYSPVAYMAKMLDEDISVPLTKEREKLAARRA